MNISYVCDMPLDEGSGKRCLSILFDEELLERIEDFRFKHRFPTRVEAIRWLIKAAIDKKLTPNR